MPGSGLSPSRANLTRKTIPVFPPLEYWLEELPQVAARCMQYRDYTNAAQACGTCRMAFTAFFHKWGSDPKDAERKEISRLRRGLTECLRAIRAVTRFDERDRANQLDEVKKFAANVSFELKLLALLLHHGREGVQEALKKDDPEHL